MYRWWWCWDTAVCVSCIRTLYPMVYGKTRQVKVCLKFLAYGITFVRDPVGYQWHAHTDIARGEQDVFFCSPSIARLIACLNRNRTRLYYHYHFIRSRRPSLQLYFKRVCVKFIRAKWLNSSSREQNIFIELRSSFFSLAYFAFGTGEYYLYIYINIIKYP